MDLRRRRAPSSTFQLTPVGGPGKRGQIYFSSVISTHHWGFDKDSKGVVSKVPATKATKGLVEEHLKILRKGFGLKDVPGSMAYFKDMGWTFRTAPGP